MKKDEKITFRKVRLTDKDTIFDWLDTPHMQEFWDNSQKHRDDIINFIEGRKVKSDYFGGMNVYWLGAIADQPFAFILSHYEADTDDTPEPYRSYVSKTGKTIGLDFGIGNIEYVGKGFSHLTLISFMDFIVKEIDPAVDTFMIDPSLNNPRAIHVYQKAGFVIMTEYIQEGGYFDQSKGVLMVKKFHDA